ncbi:MAG: hypothetical protein ACI9U2_001615 [Bradymonadia bacterium]
MAWVVELGVGLLLGAIVIGLVLFHRRTRAGGSRAASPMPLDAQSVRRLGYLPVGSLAARRLQGAVPIIFEWQDGPVWRTAIDGPVALDLDAPDVQILLGRLGNAEVVQTARSLELQGGEAGVVDHHLAAAELLSVLRGRAATPLAETSDGSAVRSHGQ